MRAAAKARPDRVSGKRARGFGMCGMEQAHLDRMLVRCAIEGDLANLEGLLAAGADPGARLGGVTAMMMAASCGREGCVKALLGKSDLRASDREGLTPLMHAIGANASGAVLELLIPGSDLGQRDGAGQTALVWAALMGQAAAVRALLIAGGPPEEGQGRSSPLMAAASMGFPECVRILLGACDPLARDVRGYDALMFAVCCGSARCVELLLPVSDLGARPECGGSSASELAAAAGSQELSDLISAYRRSQEEAKAFEAEAGMGKASKARRSI